MTSTTPSRSDPTLVVAERQLAMLGELAQMAMVAARAHAAADVAAAHAVEEILADKFWQPETGRARALAGAKDAADSFQKVSRAVRLTLMLEKTVAEWVRDIRLGVATPQAAGRTPGVRAGFPDLQQEGRCPAGSPPDEDQTGRPDAERREFERPESLLGAPFRETVERIAADIGVPIDWAQWGGDQPDLTFEAYDPPPRDFETRPPPGAAKCREVRPFDYERPPLEPKPALSP